MRIKATILFSLFFLTFYCANAQSDSMKIPDLPNVDVPDISNVPGKYIQTIDDKVDAYQSRISKKTLKTLTKLTRWENKLKKLVEKADPALSKKLFVNPDISFQSLLNQYKKGEAFVSEKRASYDSYRDKMTTQFKYLESQKEAFEKSTSVKITQINSKIETMNRKAEEAGNIDELIKKRKKELLSASIKLLGKNKYASKISKETWYYTESIKNYKDIFSSPEKAEQKTVELLNKIPAFKEFARKNSMLASLFKTNNVNGNAATLTGLQTRSQVTSLINNQISAGGADAKKFFQQNMQEAQKQLNSLKEKLNKNSGFSDEPDFKPNTQKTKTFKQRLEYGMNVQFGKQNSWMPGSTDIALTLGYKLNDKSVAGIGASYKLGLGSISNFKISHEGIGFRSFIDWKLRKQFYVSGGFELNHNAGFKKVNELRDFNLWQQSGLIGITRKIPIKTKLSKSTKVQILYDFLHKQHKPTTQPFIFRIGYNF